VKTFTDLAAMYRVVGPLRFVLVAGGLMGAIIGFAIVYAALAGRIGWPEAYGFSCSRKCLFAHMWHSRKLLEGGSGAELALFAMIWFVPALSGTVALGVTLRRWVLRRRGRIGAIPSD